MLTKLALQNFKAWEKCAIDLGRITVLIGPNGSGKSSLLQALGLLKQSRNQKSPFWNGPYESLGRFEDVVSSWGDRRNIRFSLSLTDRLRQGIPNVSGQFECDYSCVLDASGLVEHKAEYHFAGGSMMAEYDFQTASGTVGVWPSDLIDPVQIRPGSSIAFPSHFRYPPRETGMRQAVQGLRDIILNHLSNTHIVKTQRAVNAASYTAKPTGDDFTDAGDVVNFVAYQHDVCDYLSAQLSNIFEEDIELSAKFLPDYRVILELRRGREYTNIAHEGAGVQNIIWPLVQMAASPAELLIAFEEPEVHLHPKAQSQIGPVLNEITTHENKQIIVTTQSEHILMGFLTEAVKSGASPEDFRVYYCTSHNRVAEIEELRLDPNGGLDGGLKGFFEAGFDETQRYLEALTARNSG